MREVSSNFNPTDVEAAIRAFWRQESVYDQVRALRQNGRPFFFVDGPPYTTGHIHLGTAWNKIIKDSILRSMRMQGFSVIDRAGYDMHGLPIEVRVEHELGFKSKKEIEDFGIGTFIERCKEFALYHKDIMSEQFMALGVWLDFDDPYQTLSDEYIEAAWWTLKQADEKGLLEQGHRVVNWCPRCETAIADSEVEYWDERDPSIFVKFPITGKEEEFLVIWTTTPWTLPANVGVAVDEGFTYARVQAVKDGRSEILWIAEELVEPVLRKGRYQHYTVLEKRPGSDLIGVAYESPLGDMVPAQKTIRHRVVGADFVEMENTGMVHIAPGHGWDDYLLGLKEGLDVFCPVGEDGRFSAEAGIFEGLQVRDANHQVLDALGDYLLASEQIEHRYGHCWRCKTPIIYRATEQWFIPIPAIKEQMLREIEGVSWYPDWAGSARFHDFVADARDWCISRQRYWGIPIPVWVCPSCRARRVFATFAELEEVSGQKLQDPHRPWVDRITVPCACGEAMRRVPDIFDVWFDSAVASWATLRFPRQREAFEKHWPADFITEGQDQTRGWFYSQLAASTIAHGRSPYRNVLMHGFALDAEGRKMSKSFGNVVAPAEVVDQYGVDVLRLYLLSANAPWDDLKFNWDGVKTVNRTINILWNVYRFPITYMLLDRFTPEAAEGAGWSGAYVGRRFAAMAPEDRWIVSRINSVSRLVSTEMAGFQLHRATRMLIAAILEDISRWYIQLARPRMWLEEDSAEKRDAYETIYYVMRRLAGLLAPFCPHIADEIYGNLRLDTDPASVHLTDWFGGEEELIDEVLEEQMDLVRSFDEAVANARQAGKRKLRWPVKEIVVVTGNGTVAAAVEALGEICRDRANSRTVQVVRGRWERIGWKAEPVMRALGPAFGKAAPKVKALIEGADGNMLKAALDQEGQATLEGYLITPAMAKFSEQLPGSVFSAPMKDATVYIDVALDDDLEAEGYAREIIRRIQEMRRMMDLRVEDFIDAGITVRDERVLSLLSGIWQEKVEKEVRAATLSFTPPAGWPAGAGVMEKDWDVEGVPMKISISVAREQR